MAQGVGSTAQPSHTSTGTASNASRHTEPAAPTHTGACGHMGTRLHTDVKKQMWLVITLLLWLLLALLREGDHTTNLLGTNFLALENVVYNLRHSLMID